MSLADNLQQARHAHHTKKGPSCTVGKLIATSDPADRTALQDALNAPADEWPTTAIATATGIKPHTVRRHRRGECSCDQIGAHQ